MKKFLKRIFIFLTLGGLIFVSGMFLPTTPKASKYVLFSKKTKDSLLQNVSSPRIVFIGGSNIVFELNCQLIKDSLNLNPINTGSTATVGLTYMINNTEPYIRKGDIVVLSPEYQHYFGKFAYGNQDMLRMVFDVDFETIKTLNKLQWINLIKKSPSYFASKFNYKEYINVRTDPVYNLSIYNEFGDSVNHWDLKKSEITPDDFSKRSFNNRLIKELLDFEKRMIKKGVKIYFTYPGFQSTSFDLNKSKIEKVEKELNNAGFNLLGTAERYRMPDSLMFDTPYHLIREGVKYRTELLIQDLQKEKLN